MGELNISINNRSFRIACADGDEQRVARLAENLAGRIGDVKKSVSAVGDSHLLVLVGLTMCDEIKEMQTQLDALQSQIETSSQNQEVSDTRARDFEQSVTGGLSEATQRLHTLAESLADTRQD